MEARHADDQNGDLIRVAGAVSDGARVDWDAEESTRPDLSTVLGSLRVVEGVVQGHRALGGEEETGDPTTWGPLVIRARIGRGGFADVFRAYDPALQAEVALKLRRPSKSASDATQFLNEARRLAKVRHDNVLVVHGADDHDGRVGLWTDLVRGQTLEQILADEGLRSSEEAAQIGIEVCRALAAVHAAGLVHRDVKTMNVMRAERGRYVLTDFGSVAPASELGVAGSLTAGEGTPLTMAPEQLRGEAFGPAADLWGVGVLLYRLVSRRYPIEASSFTELVRKHERHEIVPLRDVRPDVSPAFARVVERALSFDPRRRYQSAGAMEQDLMKAVGLPVEDHQDIWPPWMKAAAMPLAAAAGLAILAGGLIAFHQVEGRMPWERRPAPAPAAPAVPAKLTATARLYRESEGGATVLLPGMAIQPGDQLYLEILGSDSMFVYVLNQDEKGLVYALYPGPSFDLKGPLVPGVTHRLPGKHQGTPVSWKVSSAGGRETIAVIASRRPQPDIEQDISRIPGASMDAPVAYGAVSPRTLEVLRGIGGITSAPPAAGQGDLVSKIFQKIPVNPDEARDFWTWQIDLVNP